MDKSLRFKLKGETAVFVDWANVYGWKKSLKQEVDPRKLYKYLKTYKEVKTIYFCFGTDKHPKSKKQISQAKHLGYEIITKPVKYILIAEVNKQKIYKRKCDLDMEISIEVHNLLTKDIQSFIFFTGDGDFEPLYRMLIKSNRQVVVVYAHGHLGKEVWKLERGIFKKAIDKLGADLFY